MRSLKGPAIWSCIWTENCRNDVFFRRLISGAPAPGEKSFFCPVRSWIKHGRFASRYPTDRRVQKLFCGDCPEPPPMLIFWPILPFRPVIPPWHEFHLTVLTGEYCA